MPLTPADLAAIKTLLDPQFENIGSRLNNLETKFDSLETKLDSLETKLGSLETKLDSLETKLGSLETKLDNHTLQNEKEHKSFKRMLRKHSRDIDITIKYFDGDIWKARLRLNRIDEHLNLPPIDYNNII